MWVEGWRKRGTEGGSRQDLEVLLYTSTVPSTPSFIRVEGIHSKEPDRSRKNGHGRTQTYRQTFGRKGNRGEVREQGGGETQGGKNREKKHLSREKRQRERLHGLSDRGRGTTQDMPVSRLARLHACMESLSQPPPSFLQNHIPPFP